MSASLWTMMTTDLGIGIEYSQYRRRPRDSSHGAARANRGLQARSQMRHGRVTALGDTVEKSA
eukprot:scaffold15690_cov66-Phaeocystis_antarctica.AAC.3